MILSVSGILSSAVFGIGAQRFQSRMQKAQAEFQQFGQDLESDNLSAAPADFATLQQLQALSAASSATESSGSIRQDFTPLAADLKAGNVTAAQQDFTASKKDLQRPPTIHYHHHHSRDSDGSNAIGQLFSQLGQALPSGNLSTAQQAYAALQQDFSQYAQVNALPAHASTSSVWLNA